jgi:hypothetical protein
MYIINIIMNKKNFLKLQFMKKRTKKTNFHMKSLKIQSNKIK